MTTFSFRPAVSIHYAKSRHDGRHDFRGAAAQTERHRLFGLPHAPLPSRRSDLQRVQTRKGDRSRSTSSLKAACRWIDLARLLDHFQIDNDATGGEDPGKVFFVRAVAKGLAEELRGPCQKKGSNRDSLRLQPETWQLATQVSVEKWSTEIDGQVLNMRRIPPRVGVRSSGESLSVRWRPASRCDEPP